MNNMTPKRYSPDWDGDMFEDEYGEYVHIDDYNILAQKYAELLEKTNTLAESGTNHCLNCGKTIEGVGYCSKECSDEAMTEDERELFTDEDVNDAFFGKDKEDGLKFPFWEQ